MDIRRAEISDLATVSDLFDAYRQFYKQPSDIDGARAFVQARLSQQDSVIFLAVAAQIASGFVQLYPSFSSVGMGRIYILNDLFVVRSARRQGVATALLKKSETFAAEAGALRLILSTEVINAPGQALYTRAGWQKDTLFVHYYKKTSTLN